MLAIIAWMTAGVAGFTARYRAADGGTRVVKPAA
jgi:hypothetical protein